MHALPYSTRKSQSVQLAEHKMPFFSLFSHIIIQITLIRKQNMEGYLCEQCLDCVNTPDHPAAGKNTWDEKSKQHKHFSIWKVSLSNHILTLPCSIYVNLEQMAYPWACQIGNLRSWTLSSMACSSPTQCSMIMYLKSPSRIICRAINIVLHPALANS